MKKGKTVFIGLLLALIATTVQAARFDPAKGTEMAGGSTDFDFVVMADVQEPPMFRENLKWLDSLGGEFGVMVGDLTPGYTDPVKQAAFWDEFEKTADGLKSPYVMVPGNHDVYDDASTATWKKRYGPMWFSWNNKGCHFIALESVLKTPNGMLAKEQVEWLKKDLEVNRNARATFVFSHWPLWFAEYEGEKWAASIHPLLAAAGVDYVFCGHEHHYELGDKKDGVQYVMMGPTAGQTGNSFGSFHNALLVSVRGNAVSYRLLTPAGERRKDFYTREVARKAESPLDMAPITKIGKNRLVDIALTVVNPWNDRPVKVVAALNPGAGSWKAVRMQKDIPAGKALKLVLKTKTGRTVMPLPMVTLEMSCEGERVFLKEALPVVTAKIPGLKEKVVDDFNDGDDYNSCRESGISMVNDRWRGNADKHGASKIGLKAEAGALHITGARGKSAPPNWTYANFTTWLAGEHPVNLTGSTGVSFRAKVAKPAKWGMNIEGTVNGTQLSRTGRGHTVAFAPTSEWKEYRFFWHEFYQPEWVDAKERAGPLKVDKMEGLSWNALDEGAEFDLLLDDVKVLYE